MAERGGIRTLRVELPTAASKPAAALANGDLSPISTYNKISAAIDCKREIRVPPLNSPGALVVRANQKPASELG